MFRVCVFIFLIASSLFAQSSLPVVFTQTPTRNTTVGTVVYNGTVYVSLSDLAKTFNLKISSNLETKKVEIVTSQVTMRLAADNAFVVVIDQNRNASVAQLQENILYASNSYFAPVEEFLPVLDDIMREDISYDRTKQAIIVGRSVPASAYDITGLSFDEKSNGYLVRIHCSKKLSDYESWLKQENDDTWLYITLANARADANTINRIKPSGFVKKILVFQSPSSVQITFKLKGLVNSTELMKAEGSDDILVTVHRPTEEQVATRKTRDYERQLTRERSRWKLDVIVIDAGHGGNDPGTIGIGRTKEKDITFGVALKLGKLLEKKLKDVKVVYTRKSDEFVELYRRGQIANQAEGKLFISIHCNAMPHKPNSTNGFEIYLLRPGKTDNALRIAERENAVVKFEEGYEQRYQKLTEDNFILLTMAQSAYVKYSEKFADILQQEMGKHTNLENNGVKQAGFFVLVGASMPNVLVETAYLSNKHDQKILKSAAGQQRIAESIFSAVARYKREYEKSLQEGKDLGAR